jgi:3-oxoacyl-[acyl-carrier protein] reductase
MIPIDLTGKNALITGGTRGIGRVISAMLAQAGATTYAVYRTDETSAMESLAERNALLDVNHRNYQCDISVASEIDVLTEQLKSDTNNRLDILVHNAAAGARGTVQEISEKDWRRVMDTNLTSAFLLAKALTPIMPGGSSIINIASGAGHDGLPGLSCYGASKAGLILFTHSLAQDLGPLGIRANVVSPGATDTSFGGGPPSEEKKAKVASQNALRRMGVPNDVAGVVLFLVSDLASFVTGQSIRVNGGVM